MTHPTEVEFTFWCFEDNEEYGRIGIVQWKNDIGEVSDVGEISTIAVI